MHISACTRTHTHTHTHACAPRCDSPPPQVLDPLRDELGSHELGRLTPPKIVVIGDESAGKSTVLEQLLRMPLFPRKKIFCTRLPIHVRLRRPDAEVAATVTLSVVTSEDYRRHGHDAPPEQPACTIATASGYHHVQDKMDELERQFGGASGVVSDRIIVLSHSSVDVVHAGILLSFERKGISDSVRRTCRVYLAGKFFDMK